MAEESKHQRPPMTEDHRILARGLRSWSQTDKYSIVVPDSAKILASKAVGATTAPNRQSLYRGIVDYFQMFNKIVGRDGVKCMLPELKVEVRDDIPPKRMQYLAQKCDFDIIMWSHMPETAIRPKCVKPYDVYECIAIIYCRTPKKKLMTGGLAGVNALVDAITRWFDVTILDLPWPIVNAGFYSRAKDLRKKLLESPHETTEESS